MKKQLFLFLALLTFTFHYCNDNFFLQKQSKRNETGTLLCAVECMGHKQLNI